MTGVESTSDAASTAACRFCGTPLRHVVVDLGMSPLCESFLSADQLNQMEPFYPLRVYVCGECFLVQLEEYVTPEHIFSDYAYFSSYSDSWLRHAEKYVELAIDRFGLGPASLVVEVASNDGYLLQYFVQRGIPALGIEPAANVAKVAVERGVPTLVKFFGRQTARELVAEGRGADLIAGNNVLAQVPDLNDFIGGLKILLKPGGVITLEFPHLSRLMEENQFDTIYHEHFSYFSAQTVDRMLMAHGLRFFDCEELKSHGGSLRVFACHDDDIRPVADRLRKLLSAEESSGICALDTYTRFASQVERTKRRLLSFLIEARDAGKRVAGYGAPGKGNTLLNYCGIRTDFLDYTVDRSPHKHGKFLPGTHIPIFPPEKLREDRPDYVLILPWNLRREIMDQHAYIREWGGRFVVPIPELTVFE